MALGKPAYVVNINADENRVVLGELSELAKTRMNVSRINWLMADMPLDPFDCSIQIRYNHRGAPGNVHLVADDNGDINKAVVEFNEPITAITPGQAAVFYDSQQRVLGGGWIYNSE